MENYFRFAYIFFKSSLYDFLKWKIWNVLFTGFKNSSSLIKGKSLMKSMFSSQGGPSNSSHHSAGFWRKRPAFRGGDRGAEWGRQSTFCSILIQKSCLNQFYGCWMCVWATGLPCSSNSRVCLQCRRPRFDPWVEKLLRRREWQSTSEFLLGESHR